VDTGLQIPQSRIAGLRKWSGIANLQSLAAAAFGHWTRCQAILPSVNGTKNAPSSYLGVKMEDGVVGRCGS